MCQNNFLYKIRLYIFFILYVLIFIKFSTSIVNAEIYKITKIELSEPYELNFNKNKVIENAFKNAFNELIKKITISKDFLKLQNTNIKIVKNLVDSFTVIDEKFVDNKYFATFEVNFNKKLVHNYLEKRNVFTSIPIEKELFVMPVLIDLDKKQTLLFSENFFYNNWNNSSKKHHLLKYILPNEDLEDILIIKKNFENIENYDFKEILLKYDIEDYIIIIFFRNNENIRTLSKITLNKNNIIINEVFNNVKFDNIKSIEEIISILKTKFENRWKKMNQINTSIKFPITIQIESKNYKLIQKLEHELFKLDLVSKFYIENFNNQITTYKIIYNGTPDRFIHEINKNDISLNTSFKIWRIE